MIASKFRVEEFRLIVNGKDQLRCWSWDVAQVYAVTGDTVLLTVRLSEEGKKSRVLGPYAYMARRDGAFREWARQNIPWPEGVKEDDAFFTDATKQFVVGVREVRTIPTGLEAVNELDAVDRARLDLGGATAEEPTSVEYIDPFLWSVEECE